jgi:nuclear transport factor 2 (NTF2) superfamily protein
LWDFDENGLMKQRDVSINDYEMDEPERKFR